MKYGIVLIALLWASASSAQVLQQTAAADLPSNEIAEQLLTDDPSVVQARHALEAARHRAVGLTAGSQEWVARGTAQRRRDRGNGVDFNEWTVGLERAIRIGGKAGLDRQLGEAHERLAGAKLGEARHEAARELLAQWLDWLAAEQTRQLWTEQIGFAQENLKAANTRRKAGDASKLEENAAQADLAEVQRQLSTAANELAKARLRLHAHFPSLALQVPPLSEPLALGGDPGAWREQILDESDELRITKEELRQAELLAARARADRIADPTLGVHTSSERAGAERIVGVSISMPIGGTARASHEREGLQQVEAARAAVERKQRELEAEIAANLADAAGSLERWRFADHALAAGRENTRLTQRAYTLGEADLQTLFLARRQAVEAALGAAQARIDALRARYRLLVDAHLIWGLSHD
jgi:outer membrane protein TolC